VYNYQSVSDRFRRATRDGILTYARIHHILYYTLKWVCVNRTDDEGQTRRSFFFSYVVWVGIGILYKSEDGHFTALTERQSSTVVVQEECANVYSL
jgi:hypothetical protein